MTPLTILGQLFYEPGKAFVPLRERSSPWLPLAIMIVLSSAIFYWYFSVVDFNWLIDRMAAATGKADAADVMRQAFSKNMMMYSSLAGIVFGTPIFYALYGTYFLLAGRFLGSDTKFNAWFAFAVWISVPNLLVLPLMALQILTSHGQLAMEDISMVTLNYLVFHLQPSHPWAGLLNSLNLATFWTIFLSIVGLREWTGRSTAACSVVALLPYVLIYGAWAAKIALFH